MVAKGIVRKEGKKSSWLSRTDLETTRSSHSSSKMTSAAVTSHLPKGHLVLETQGLQGFPADCSFCTFSFTTVTSVAAQQLKLGEGKLSDISNPRKCRFRIGGHLCGEDGCTSSLGGGVLCTAGQP